MAAPVYGVVGDAPPGRPRNKSSPLEIARTTRPKCSPRTSASLAAMRGSSAQVALDEAEDQIKHRLREQHQPPRQHELAKLSQTSALTLSGRDAA